MTAAEWDAATDPHTMAHGLHRVAGRRKLLLFACECYRRFLDPAGAGRDGVELLERYAEGRAAFEEITRFKGGVQLDDPAWPLFTGGLGSTTDFWASEFGRYHAAWQTAGELVSAATARKPGRPSRRDAERWAQTRAELVALLHCVFGNPYRGRVEIDPSWLTADATALATSIYSERAFDRLPILADALQDAGCENADILSHCRSAGSHTRGCWVVDLVLGKPVADLPG